MNAPSTLQRVLIVLIATVLLALSGSMAWATVEDFQSRGRVPSGVSVAGTPLGGLTEQQARSAIEQAVSAPLMRPITAVAASRSFTFDPKGAVEVDVDGMLVEAYQPRRSAPFVARLRHDLTGVPLPAEVQPRFTVDKQALDEWTRSIAKQVNRSAKDSTISEKDRHIEISQSVNGARLDVKASDAAVAALFAGSAGLAEGARTAMLPVATIKPKVTEDSFGKAIVVDLSERRIRLFDGEKLEKTYPCAIGTPDHPTPVGDFEIVLKRYRPTWVNPGSEWAKSMPPYIPPGPGNPLGTRALNLSASGIRFHGTENIGSVGTAASHGCMRMVRHDIEDLYERVEVGTPVYIRP